MIEPTLARCGTGAADAGHDAMSLLLAATLMQGEAARAHARCEHAARFWAACLGEAEEQVGESP